MAIDVLMIIAVDNDPDYMKSIVAKAENHLNMFRYWCDTLDGGIVVLGPDDTGIAFKTGEYQGDATNVNIIAKLGAMTAAEKFVYIDDHSVWVNGKWHTRLFDNNYSLNFNEFNNNMLTNCTLICRGNGSGEAVTNPLIAKPGRRVYCSMHDNQSNGQAPDTYDLSNAQSPGQLDMVHDMEYMRLHPHQTPQKYIGF